MADEEGSEHLVSMSSIKPIVISPIGEKYSDFMFYPRPVEDNARQGMEHCAIDKNKDCVRSKHVQKDKKLKTKGKKLAPRSAQRGARCCVHNCTNTQYDEMGFSTGLQFFIIPYDKTLSEEWIAFLQVAAGKSTVTINTSTKVCSAHFPRELLDSCYNSRIGKSRLKSGMTPSILPSDLSQKSSDQDNGTSDSLPIIGVDCSGIIKSKQAPCLSPSETKAMYTCEDCDKAFICYGDYYMHMESHSGLPNNQRHLHETQCMVCSTTHLGTHSIMKHMRQHTTDKPYVCGTCRRGFDSPKDRSEHICVLTPDSCEEECEMIDDNSQHSEECVIIDLDDEDDSHQDCGVIELSADCINIEVPPSGKTEPALLPIRRQNSSSRDCAIGNLLQDEDEVKLCVPSSDNQGRATCECTDMSHTGSQVRSLQCGKCYREIVVKPKKTEKTRLESDDIQPSSKRQKPNNDTLQQTYNTSWPNHDTQQESHNTLPQSNEMSKQTDESLQQNDAIREHRNVQDPEEHTQTPKRRVKFTQYQCDACTENFICYGDYYQHEQMHLRKFRSHCKPSVKPALVIPCLVCRQLYPSSALVIEHTALHTHALPFICDVCGEEFQSFVERKIHNSKPCGFDIEEELSDEEGHADIYVPGMALPRSKDVDQGLLSEITEVTNISEEELAFVNSAVSAALNKFKPGSLY